MKDRELIALDNELKKEMINIGILFLIAVIILKMVFYKQDTLTVIRIALSLFWLFVIPGFTLMYYWKEKLDFLTRLIAGTILGIAVTGVLGYNLGILGINLTIQTIILPVLCIAFGLFLASKKNSNRNSQNKNSND